MSRHSISIPNSTVSVPGGDVNVPGGGGPNAPSPTRARGSSTPPSIDTTVVPRANSSGAGPVVLVGTSTGGGAGPPMPSAPGQAWSMGQAVGGGAVSITYARGSGGGSGPSGGTTSIPSDSPGRSVSGSGGARGHIGGSDGSFDSDESNGNTGASNAGSSNAGGSPSDSGGSGGASGNSPSLGGGSGGGGSGGGAGGGIGWGPPVIGGGSGGASGGGAGGGIGWGPPVIDGGSGGGSGGGAGGGIGWDPSVIDGGSGGGGRSPSLDDGSGGDAGGGGWNSSGSSRGNGNTTDDDSSDPNIDGDENGDGDTHDPTINDAGDASHDSDSIHDGDEIHGGDDIHGGGSAIIVPGGSGGGGGGGGLNVGGVNPGNGPPAPAPAPAPPPAKPWLNPPNPTRRHLRIATAGIGTSPADFEALGRDIQVLGTCNQLDGPAAVDQTKFEFVSVSLDVASRVKIPSVRVQIMNEAQTRLTELRASLAAKQTIPVLKDKRAEALRLADDALASANAAFDPDKRLEQLQCAHSNLYKVHLCNNAAGRPDEPDLVLTYIEARIAEAEVAAAPDQKHLNAHLNSESVQKVYVAPEWLFRSRAGAPYTPGEFEEIKVRLADLSRRYSDWLIIPGTVYYGAPDKHGKFLVHNDALVVHAGTVSVVSKEHEADLLAPNEVWSPTNGTLTRYTVGTHNCAVEICRDHSKGRAAAESDELVDFHVITSNNVAVDPLSVVARDGGVVVHVDGAKGTTAFYRVRWKSNPAISDCKAFRDRVKTTRGRVVEIEANVTALCARIQLIADEINGFKRIRKQGKLSRKEATTLKQREQDRARLDEEYEVLVAEKKRLETQLKTDAMKYIDVTRLETSSGPYIRDDLLELEQNRYA